MDGIIQGAKFEMPAYFDDANGNARSAGNGNDDAAADTPAAVAITTPSPKPLRFGLSSPLPTISVPEALDQLKLAILNDKNSLESRDKEELSLRPHLDGDTVTFLSRWLKNNPYPKSTGGGGNDFSDDNDGDEMAKEERLLHAESERDALGLQVSILGEQVGRQTSRLQDMEQLLAAKKELLRKTEMALDRERKARTAMEESNGHLGELSRLRKRCSELERENEELRKICTGNRTPRLLNLSPTMGSPPLSSRDAALDLGSSSPENEVLRKGVGFGEAEIIPDGVASAADHSPSASGRPPRGLKKILGKIKRSNSGGQLEGDTLKRSGSAAANGNHAKSEFRRGGFRSTAGGRLGGWNSQGAMSSTAAARRDLSRRPVAEWNVDMICTWLDCLGLGMYSTEVQKTIGTGDDLAKMTLGDLENKLNVRNGMHRKKLFLALAARNDSGRPDAEGRLDFQWVLRWLDDIGLPQYKDA